MTSNMPSSDTNKLITATLHPVYHHFAVPNDWDIEDITYESGILLYKGKKQYVPKVVDDGECKDLDKLEEGNWMDFDVYFDCDDGFDLYKYEEKDDEEEEEAPLCYRKNGSKCKWCDNLCVDEEDSLCHECYHKSNPSECYCDEEENSAWLEKQEKEEEKEYTIEIPVVGLGYCQYYDKEDRDKYVVYCKNAVWKKKGDKTARDMEGNYCETESEAEEEEDDEEIYYCCDCCIKLDRVRDGEEEPDFRCNNCYWEDEEGIDSKNIITPDYRKQEASEEEDLCEKCDDINCCTKDELICCMCCELLKCDMFSQNCGKCLKPICMDCDNDERKINGENVCKKCERKKEKKERKKEQEQMKKEDKFAP